MKLAILGFGREGQSLLRFLRRRGSTRNLTQTNAEITILDKNPNLKIPKGTNSILGPGYLNSLKNFEIIYRSPGIPYNLPEIQAYEKRASATGSGNAKAPMRILTSATKLFFEEIKNNQLLITPPTHLRISLRSSYELWRAGNYQLPKIIGVTGSKGKGTTATLIYKILKASGKKAYLAGNIGLPMLDILPRLSLPAGRQARSSPRESAFIVLELSSFQLQDLAQSPDVAVVLDIFPDHLDSHKNLEEYYEAKASIGRWQKKSDVIFYFNNNTRSKSIALKSPARHIAVTPKENTLKKNFEMAAAVARHLKCPEKIIKKAIADFRGLEHRLELVQTQQHSNILQNVRMLFFNDSAATNPEATAAAIRTLTNSEMANVKSKNGGKISISHVALPMSLILIAGGKDKNLDYQPLAQAIKDSSQIKLVILFGENKQKIKSKISNIKSGVDIKITNNLKSAVTLAHKSAKKLINSSTDQLITILFSPASASFDMFKNYEDRGAQFTQLVKSLK